MFYKLFRDSLPDYLVRHYWWAYLWRVSVWFFDHQPIINAILFGQYGRLMRRTLSALDNAPNDSVLQLTCVYGSLTSNILQHISPHCLHLTDVAPVQLRLAVQKTPCKACLLPTRMNAECLGYKSNSFTTVILFFLLHELPAEARSRTLTEVFRVLAPGGRLMIVEYASLPSQHFLYRFFLSRYLLNKYESIFRSILARRSR